MAFTHRRTLNTIALSGDFSMPSLPQILSEVYKTIEIQKFEDVILDFSNTRCAFADAMVPLCADIIRHKEKGIDFSCILPTLDSLKKQFINANWAHIIDNTYKESTFKGYSQYPTSIVKNDDHLSECVNGVLECTIRASNIQHKNDFATIEWALNEIIENTLRHSESNHGGLIHLSKFSKNNQRVEIVVADAGIGIPNSLRTAPPYSQLQDYELVELATHEGVTNGKGMGNGLYGARELSVSSGGYFKIYSNHGFFNHHTPAYKNPVAHIRHMKIPFSGTAICFALDYSTPGILESALKFKGNSHHPISTYLETRYVDPTAENVLIFELASQTEPCSTRNNAEKLRQKIENFIRMENPQGIVLNFNNAPNMSSSYADELFGKLLILLGPEVFTSTIHVRNLSPANKTILSRAIGQRMLQVNPPQ